MAPVCGSKWTSQNSLRKHVLLGQRRRRFAALPAVPNQPLPSRPARRLRQRRGRSRRSPSPARQRGEIGGRVNEATRHACCEKLHGIDDQAAALGRCRGAGRCDRAKPTSDCVQPARQVARSKSRRLLVGLRANLRWPTRVDRASPRILTGLASAGARPLHAPPHSSASASSACRGVELRPAARSIGPSGRSGRGGRRPRPASDRANGTRRAGNGFAGRPCTVSLEIVGDRREAAEHRSIGGDAAQIVVPGARLARPMGEHHGGRAGPGSSRRPAFRPVARNDSARPASSGRQPSASMVVPSRPSH